jgi:hypothetical protein
MQRMEAVLNSMLRREPEELAEMVEGAEAVIAAQGAAKKGSTLSPERWKQVEELVYAALDCEPDRRSAFLEEACGGDEELRRKVESLVAAYDSEES